MHGTVVVASVLLRPDFVEFNDVLLEDLDKAILQSSCVGTWRVLNQAPRMLVELPSQITSMPPPQFLPSMVRLIMIPHCCLFKALEAYYSQRQGIELPKNALGFRVYKLSRDGEYQELPESYSYVHHDEDGNKLQMQGSHHNNMRRYREILQHRWGYYYQGYAKLPGYDQSIFTQNKFKSPDLAKQNAALAAMHFIDEGGVGSGEYSGLDLI